MRKVYVVYKIDNYSKRTYLGTYPDLESAEIEVQYYIREFKGGYEIVTTYVKD